MADEYIIILPAFMRSCPEYWQHFAESTDNALYYSLDEALKPYNGSISKVDSNGEYRLVFETTDDFLMFKLRWS